MNAKKDIITAWGVVKNWIAYTAGVVTPVPVGYLIVGVTYSCSARCKMCEIYDFYAKNPGLLKDELDLGIVFRRLRESQLVKKVNHIDLTGGEPFLKKDLKDLIINIFSLPNINLVTINTNGMFPDKIAADAEAILKSLGKNKFFSISVSIDGIGKVHDAIRGVDGLFAKVEDTIARLKELRDRYPAFSIRSNAVMQPGNINQLGAIKEYWDKHDIKGAYGLLQAPLYTKEKAPAELSLRFSDGDIAAIESAEPKSVGMNYYLANGFKRPLHCFAGYSAVFIDPFGKVFPCNFLAGDDIYAMGSIKEASLDSIWASSRASEVRRKVKVCSYIHCWNGCEVDQTMIQFGLLNKLIRILSLGSLSYYKLARMKGFE